MKRIKDLTQGTYNSNRMMQMVSITINKKMIRIMYRLNSNSKRMISNRS